MEDHTNLREAAIEEVADSLTFSLRYDRGKTIHTADECMVPITAHRLVEHLKRSGFVILKNPPIAGHSSSAYMLEEE